MSDPPIAPPPPPAPPAPPPAESATCAICLEEIDPSSSDKHTLAQCAHIFHASCLLKWTLTSNNGRTCPTCRSAPPALGFFTATARASYLRRTVARRKNAPAELLVLVGRLRAAEANAREASRRSSEVRRQHAKALSLTRKARTARWTAMRKVNEAKRILGCFSSASVPLPGLLTTG